ncbi:hypothetical protein K523DRAFT_323927 [Schizophyllum commune Tattone D]|nr:hypothetical protein K523DRAFT_323927 [Schizophyllum commune Tattone D]
MTAPGSWAQVARWRLWRVARLVTDSHHEWRRRAEGRRYWQQERTTDSEKALPTQRRRIRCIIASGKSRRENREGAQSVAATG